MPRKSRKKNPNTIRAQYNKAYRNYLSRVNRQVRVGYNVDVIQRVKNPTRASIRRLEQQTAKTIKDHSTLYDMITGEEVTHNRKSAERINREFSSLSPVEQELSREQGKITKYEPFEYAISAVDITIENWYDYVEKSFTPKIAQYIKERSDAMINTDRDAFAYAIAENPDALPSPGYHNSERMVDASFSNIARIMNVDKNSEGFQTFMNNVTGIVERED